MVTFQARLSSVLPLQELNDSHSWRWWLISSRNYGY